MANDRKFEVRKMTFAAMCAETPLLELPIEFTGTRSEVEAWASEQGHEWKRAPKYLFGGYWYTPPVKGEDNICWIPT